MRICANTLVFLCALAGVVEGQSQWEIRPSNINSPLHAVAFGGGLFVAVGENGVIVTSPDGNVWTPRASGTTDRLPAVVFGNGRFVATRANRNAPAISSQDGINWTPVTVTEANGTPAASSAFNTIAFGGGHFLAAGLGPTSTEVMGIRRWSIVSDNYSSALSLWTGRADSDADLFSRKVLRLYWELGLLHIAGRSFVEPSGLAI